MSERESILSLRGVSRSFRQGEGGKLNVLKDISLNLHIGEMAALVGASGAGKSTLLHICGLLEKPDVGDIFLCGENAKNLNDEKRTALRGRNIGFVYQYHHLLPEFSAIENVQLPQLMRGIKVKAAKERSEDLLASVGLQNRMQHRPAQLSGGEQQRVAIARALANAPKLLLADEPTGNLDHQTAEQIFSILKSLVRQEGLAVLMATHNLDLAERMPRLIALQDGKLLEDRAGQRAA